DSRLSERYSENVWARLVVARSESEAGFFRDQTLHRAKIFDELRQQGGAGGRDQFVRFVALRHADAARAENGQGGRGGNGKASVRAIHPAGAFNDRRGQHAWFAE